MLLMNLHPEVQAKAHEEIDRVVGRDRLPNFEDRENLPYINAIVKEVLRWHPVSPLGLPHRLTQVTFLSLSSSDSYSDDTFRTIGMRDISCQRYDLSTSLILQAAHISTSGYYCHLKHIWYQSRPN